ncbi:MAG: hypothetical protein M3Q48_11885, partial [Actinomycetota bacterium]|nr:hypothetical protein [Actinomycetota bacterium]
AGGSEHPQSQPASEHPQVHPSPPAQAHVHWQVASTLAGAGPQQPQLHAGWSSAVLSMVVIPVVSSGS